jgi:hypothetical protein
VNADTIIALLRSKTKLVSQYAGRDMPDIICIWRKFLSFSRTKYWIAEAGIMAKAMAITKTINTLETAFS